MTPEQELLRNAYLAEMWPTCREVDPEERAVQAVRRQIAEWRPSTGKRVIHKP